MKINHVLVDYENVQPGSLAALDQEHFRVHVFVGASQNKVSFEIAQLLQRLGERGKYIKASASGPNALDFHIAFYLGQLSAAEPDAFFHIVSKDTGFDPLVAHLKSRKIFSARSRDVLDMPIVKASNSKSSAERLDMIVTNLRQRGNSRPRTVKTLMSTIASLFQKTIEVHELTAIVKELQQKGYVTLKEMRVAYSLPD